MATFSRPGVYIQEMPLPQAVGQANITNAAGAFVGALVKGPTTPTLVTNWTDFVKNFGNLSDSYPTTWAAYNFFANGGRQLYVRRVASSTATAGAVTFTDGTGSTTTATVTAASASGTSGNYTFTYTAANTFTAGTPVVVTGLQGSVTLTGATASGTGSGTTITFTTASTTGLSTGTVITIAGITGATTGSFNGTFTITTVTANTSFVVSPGSTVAGTAVVTSATALYGSAFNLSGTIATANGTQFTVASTASTADRSVSGASGTATVTIASNNVFTLTANSVGSWSSNISAQVLPGGVSTRFNLNIYTTVVQNGVSSTSLAESYRDLSMTTSDRNYVVAVINAYSSLVTAALSSNNTVNATTQTAAYFPAITSTSPTAFSGYSDGTNFLGISSFARSDYAVWSSFDSIVQPLVIYAADAAYLGASLSSQVHGDAVIYAASRTDCFAIIDTPAGEGTASAAQQQVNTIQSVFGSSTTGNIAAAYWPWYNIPDGTKAVGALRLQAPGAGVAGQYLNTDAVRGAAKTPAGLSNRLALAVSTEHLFTNAELDQMNNPPSNSSYSVVNPIRQVPGAGIVIMGGRTLDNTPNNRYINIRRSLIYIENALNNLTSFALFENNDSVLWNRLELACGNFLRNYWQGGNLRGTTPDQAFYVKCDSTTTSFSDIQNGRVNIQIGVALQYPAEFVVITIGQLTGNASA